MNKPLSDQTARTRKNPWTIQLTSRSQTERLGAIIGHRLQKGEIIALMGELGTGKTTLVRGLAVGAGLPSHVVSSPTFTCIQEYVGPIALAHVDLYRFDDPRNVDDAGLADYLNGRFVVILEWADRLPADWLPNDYLSVHLTHTGKYRRRATVQAFGTRSRGLLHAIQSAFG